MPKNVEVKNPRDAHLVPAEKTYLRNKDDSILFSKADLARIKKGKTEDDKALAALLEKDLTGFLLDQGQYAAAKKDQHLQNKNKLKK